MSHPDPLVKALDDEGKFKIIEQINEGANSYAFKARHIDLQRDVFLKLYAYVPGAETELLQEPQVLVSAVQTPPRCENLVDLYDADHFAHDGEEYLRLQMELVNGASLAARLEQGPVGQQLAIRLVVGVLSGVIHLHSARIVHRDLKPANIVLAGHTPKISDFGSASIVPAQCNSVSASKHSALYVPPESWNTPSIYSYQSDLYQIGIILYELANGPLCYEPEHYLTNAVSRSLKADGKKYSDLSECDKCLACDRGIAELCSSGKLLSHGREAQPFLSRKLAKVVRRATNADLSKRYRTGQEFLSDLNRLNLPNWVPVGQGEYEAEGWKGWDWNVEVLSPSDIVVRRSRPGAGSYRRIAGRTFTSITETFEFMEEFDQ